MNIFNMLGYYFIYSSINKLAIFLIIIHAIYTIKPCQAIENQNIDQTINESSLLSLQQSYKNLIHFPQQKIQKLAEGQSLVNSFKSTAVNFTELIKVIDINANQEFIDNIILQKKNNITESPGTIISAALDKMTQSEEVETLIEDIKEFEKNIKANQVDKVIGYALSQISIDKEAKRISKIEILPETLNPKNPNAAFVLLTSKGFIENMTNKISNTITDKSLTKLPLIADINKITPVEDPRIIAYKPFLYQYFLDYQGELLTDDKQINNSANELLPEPDVSSLHNAKASMQLLDSIIYMNNLIYDSSHIETKSTPNATLKKWLGDSMDSFWIKKGWLSYKFFQKDRNKSFSRFNVKSTVVSLGADKTYKDIFFRLCYGRCQSKTLSNVLGKTTIDTGTNLICLSALYQKEVYIIYGYLCYSSNENKGYRMDKKNIKHYHSNHGKLYTLNINAETLLILDKKWSFSPSIVLTYSQYHSEKYQEKSNYLESQLFDCAVNPKSNNSFLLGGNIAIKGQFINKDIKYKPKFIVAVNYNFADKNRTLDIQLHGTKAKLLSQDKDPLEFIFSIDNTISGKNISSSIKYILHVCRQFNSNIISLEFNYHF